MPDELLKEEKPKTIKLADGKEYKLSPINLNVLANLEEEFECSLNTLSKRLDKKQASELRSFVYVFLKENHPEMTREQVGKLVSMDNLTEVCNTINEVIKASGTI